MTYETAGVRYHVGAALTNHRFVLERKGMAAGEDCCQSGCECCHWPRMSAIEPTRDMECGELGKDSEQAARAAACAGR